MQAHYRRTWSITLALAVLCLGACSLLRSPGAMAHEPDADEVALGSLVDADMGAYYNWLNQQRLPGADTSSFLAWFEGHNVAVLIGPTVPRGTVSDAPIDMKQLLSWIL